jgi:hypothetical protein
VSAPTGKPGYEVSDARIAPLVFATLWLAVLIGGAMAASAWIDREYTEEAHDGEHVSPLADSREAPPGPDLLPLPSAELRAKREWETRQLTGTEWIDPVNGIVRIPIDQAIELALEEGFPVRAREEGR